MSKIVHAPNGDITRRTGIQATSNGMTMQIEWTDDQEELWNLNQQTDEKEADREGKSRKESRDPWQIGLLHQKTREISERNAVCGYRRRNLAIY